MQFNFGIHSPLNRILHMYPPWFGDICYIANMHVCYDVDMSGSMPMPMPNLTLPSGLSVPLPNVSLPYMPSAPGVLPATMNLSAVSVGGVMPLTTAQLDAAAAAAAAATQRMLIFDCFSLSAC